MHVVRKTTLLAVFFTVFLSVFAACPPAFATTQEVTASISAQNTFSNAMCILASSLTTIPGGNYFNLSLSGTWVATVFIQRSYDNGNTWMDVKSYTSNAEDTGYEPETGVCYRFGVKTGGYTSGTVVGRLSQ
jgi:hypothetical protein